MSCEPVFSFEIALWYSSLQKIDQIQDRVDVVAVLFLLILQLFRQVWRATILHDNSWISDSKAFAFFKFSVQISNSVFYY